VKSRPPSLFRRKIPLAFIIIALEIVFLAGCGRSNGTQPGSAAALLVTGGIQGNGAFASAEVFEPNSRQFVETGPMHTARLSHSAALLQNGEVLVVGGANTIDYPAMVFASAELYDPSSKSFSLTGSLATARSGHTASLLPDGKVLIAGGVDSMQQTLASAELYDPASATFAMTGSMNMDRENHTATRLANGEVLIVGGYSSTTSTVQSTAELYDPGTGMFTFTGAMTTARDGHTATPLTNGDVLIAGGGDNDGNILATTEVYDPVAGKFSAAASMTTSRYGHFAALLSNGDILIGGGIDNAGSSLASAERYLAGRGSFQKVGSMARDRFFVNASVLGNDVLIIGGFTQCPSGAASFCFEPVSSVLGFDQSSNQFQAAPRLTTKRGYYASAGL